MMLTALVLAAGLTSVAQTPPKPPTRYLLQPKAEYLIREGVRTRCPDASMSNTSGPALLRPQDRAELKAKRLADLPLGRFCMLGGAEQPGVTR
jgi:hypothetical protein